jgi:hypothetical protein
MLVEIVRPRNDPVEKRYRVEYVRSEVGDVCVHRLADGKGG